MHLTRAAKKLAATKAAADEAPKDLAPAPPPAADAPPLPVVWSEHLDEMIVSKLDVKYTSFRHLKNFHLVSRGARRAVLNRLATCTTMRLSDLRSFKRYITGIFPNTNYINIDPYFMYRRDGFNPSEVLWYESEYRRLSEEEKDLDGLRDVVRAVGREITTRGVLKELRFEANGRDRHAKHCGDMFCDMVDGAQQHAGEGQLCWPMLETLTFSNGQVNFRTIEKLSSVSLPRILHFALYDNKTSCVQALLKAPFLAQLETLDLSNNELGNSGIALLGEASMPRIHKLRLAGNGITDRGFESFIDKATQIATDSVFTTLDMTRNVISANLASKAKRAVG